MPNETQLKISIPVSQGECRFEYFNLFPALEGGWDLKYIKNKEQMSVSGVSLNFSQQSSQSELMYERCVLLIRIPAELKDADWRFVFDGIQYVDKSSSDGFQDIKTEITPDGKTLSIIIQDMNRNSTQYAQDSARIDFRFVASARNLKTNELRIFSSNDPTISIGRGEG